MVNVARPCVVERRSVAYPNIVASGTCAWMVWAFPRGSTQVVQAFVPLAQMFGYVTDLRSMTQGRATSSMEFSHYAEVPANLASELVQKSKV